MSDTSNNTMNKKQLNRIVKSAKWCKKTRKVGKNHLSASYQIMLETIDLTQLRMQNPISEPEQLKDYKYYFILFIKGFDLLDRKILSVSPFS